MWVSTTYVYAPKVFTQKKRGEGRIEIFYPHVRCTSRNICRDCIPTIFYHGRLLGIPTSKFIWRVSVCWPNPKISRLYLNNGLYTSRSQIQISYLSSFFIAEEIKIRLGLAEITGIILQFPYKSLVSKIFIIPTKIDTKWQ